MTEIELDDLIPEEKTITNINESKRYTHLAKFPKQCPFCGSSFILSDTDRVWYCYQCGAHESRIAPHIPVTDREKNEGKMYRRQKSERKKHEFVCQFPGCDTKFEAFKAGKCTKKYCDYHTNIAIGNAHTAAGRAKRRLAYQTNNKEVALNV